MYKTLIITSIKKDKNRKKRIYDVCALTDILFQMSIFRQSTEKMNFNTDTNLSMFDTNQLYG